MGPLGKRGVEAGVEARPCLGTVHPKPLDGVANRFADNVGSERNQRDYCPGGDSSRRLVRVELRVPGRVARDSGGRCFPRFVGTSA